MKSAATVLALILMTSGATLAQTKVAPPPRKAPGQPDEKANDPSTYQGAKLLRYYQLQLRLTKEQQPRFAELIAKYKEGRKAAASAAGSAAAGRVADSMQLQTELTEALQSGDAARIQKARDSLEVMFPDKAMMDQFYAEADKILDDTQKLTLKIVRDGFKDGKLIDLRVTPREAVHIAERLGLSKEQPAKVAKLQDELRGKLLKVADADEDGRQAMIEQFIVDLKAELTADQAKRFDEAMTARITNFGKATVTP